MKISQNNPKASYLAHKNELDQAIISVLSKGHYILGEQVTRFESELASFCGVNYGIGVNSGTDALLIALQASGIKSGDEVITISHTAVATVAAIKLSGANPVLVDIDPKKFTIDPLSIEKAITRKTRAILPVHLYGCPAEMDTIKWIADKHKLMIIEDCAQAHGAVYKGRIVGSIGHSAAFSFYPTKNLGGFGDGGMIITNDPMIAEKARILRGYGWKKRYISSIIAGNSRLDEIQAAVLRIKLKYLQETNNRRYQIAAFYDQHLDETIIKPELTPGHVFHQYVIRVQNRDRLQQRLQKLGIETLVHYPLPIHLQPAYLKKVRIFGKMFNTTQIYPEILSLPMFPELIKSQLSKIVHSVNSSILY